MWLNQYYKCHFTRIPKQMKSLAKMTCVALIEPSDIYEKISFPTL